jgi:hypothetical protein
VENVDSLNGQLQRPGEVVGWEHFLMSRHDFLSLSPVSHYSIEQGLCQTCSGDEQPLPMSLSENALKKSRAVPANTLGTLKDAAGGTAFREDR